jgi:hypothetical protein
LTVIVITVHDMSLVLQRDAKSVFLTPKQRHALRRFEAAVARMARPRRLSRLTTRGDIRNHPAVKTWFRAFLRRITPKGQVAA